MSFLTISNENFFFKTQGTRLGAIVAPNRGLEWALMVLPKHHFSSIRNSYVEEEQDSFANTEVEGVKENQNGKKGKR